MNIKNGNITIKEILDYPPAYEYICNAFPLIKNHPMLHRANKITLNTALMFMGDAVPQAKKNEIIAKLREL